MDNIIEISNTMVIRDINGNIITTRIEAENYTSTNKTGVFTETTSDETGVKDVGWMRSGNFLNYKITVPLAGVYTIGIRFSSVRVGELLLKLGANVLATIAMPNNTNWQKWDTVYAQVSLPEGVQTLTLYCSIDGYNINYIDILPFSFTIGNYTISEVISI